MIYFVFIRNGNKNDFAIDHVYLLYSLRIHFCPLSLKLRVVPKTQPHPRYLDGVIPLSTEPVSHPHPALPPRPTKICASNLLPVRETKSQCCNLPGRARSCDRAEHYNNGKKSVPTLPRADLSGYAYTAYNLISSIPGVKAYASAATPASSSKSADTSQILVGCSDESSPKQSSC